MKSVILGFIWGGFLTGSWVATALTHNKDLLFFSLTLSLISLIITFLYCIFPEDN